MRYTTEDLAELVFAIEHNPIRLHKLGYTRERITSVRKSLGYRLLFYNFSVICLGLGILALTLHFIPKYISMLSIMPVTVVVIPSILMQLNMSYQCVSDALNTIDNWLKLNKVIVG